MLHNRTLLIVGLLLLPAAGCRSLQGPDLFEPGDLLTQRYRAIEHDPYPSNDLGPEVVGGRPRDYDRELPSPVRHMPERVLGADGTWWAR
jgi:hypothetical protein